MIASVTDLQEYRQSHPPALRLFAAAQRAWWNWATLPAIIAMRMMRRPTL